MRYWVLSLLIFFIHSTVAEAVAETVTKIGTPYAPQQLDWTSGATFFDAQYLSLTQEGLYRCTSPLHLGVAKKLTQSKDLKTYTFELKPNAKWSDGRTITAQDFVDAWMQTLSPQSVSPYLDLFYDIQNAKEFHQGKGDELGVSALSDKLLKVQLKGPVPHWESRTCLWPFFPVRKDIIEKMGVQWSRPGALISSGPYRIQSYEENKKLFLIPNPYYWGIRSNLPSVEYRFNSDPEKLLSLFKTHELDIVTDLPSSLKSKAQNLGRLEFGTVFLKNIFKINLEKYPTNEYSFAKALYKSVSLQKPSPQEQKKIKELILKSKISISKDQELKLAVLYSAESTRMAQELARRVQQTSGITVKVNTLNLTEYRSHVATREDHLLLQDQIEFKETPSSLKILDNEFPNIIVNKNLQFTLFRKNSLEFFTDTTGLICLK